MGRIKRTSLQMIFWKFLIILILGLLLSAAVPFLLLAFASSAGYVTYANNAEHSVQEISPIIAAAPDITKVAIPSYCEYLILDADYNILYTNMDTAEQDKALGFAKTGENSDLTSRTQYQFIPREKEYCVLKYYVGSQYKNDWIQKHLPAPEIILLLLIGINCIAVCVCLIIQYSRKLKIQLSPLIMATEQIQKQNLDFEVGSSEISEYNAVLNSISEMKDSLKLSLEQQWKAEQSQREQIAALAHDLKTPLTVIQGNIDLMNETKLDDEQRLYAGYITESSEQIQVYIKTLIDISRTVTGYQLQVEKIDIADYMEQIEAQASALCVTKEIRLNMETETDRGCFEADKLLLERAIMNVVNNALEYSPQRGTIYVETQRKENFLQVIITDEGTGFTNEDLRHAREQFFMGDHSRSSNMHFGMGLYITNSIVKQHNGELTLKNSDKTGGAEVTIKIPY